jgi:hypothetical protein
MTQKNPCHSHLDIVVVHLIDRRLDTVNQIPSIYLRLILPKGYLTFVSDPIDDPFINKKSDRLNTFNHFQREASYSGRSPAKGK